MKGLLKKDFLITWKVLKYMALALVILALSMGPQDPRMLAALLAMFLILMGIMAPVYSFSYDSIAKWDVYARALPLSPGKLVLSKYILAGAFIGLGMASGISCALVLSWGLRLDVPLEEILVSVLGMGAGSLLILSLQLPACYRFGPDKARILLIAAMALAGGLFGALVSLQDRGLTASLVSQQAPMAAFFGGLFFVTLVLLIGSFFLSVRIYRRREL